MTREIWIRIGIAVAIVVVAWLINRLMRRSIRRFSQRYDLAKKDPGAETRFRMIGRLGSVVIFFLAIGLALWVVDVATLRKISTWMFASAGVTGIAVGFAAQTVFSNLISGIIIAFVQPIRLGDHVTVEGHEGNVRTVGLFYTTIEMVDNRHLLIPNKLLSDRFIENYTLIDPKTAAVVRLRLSYSTDVDAIRTLLMEAAKNHPLSLPEPEPTVRVVDMDGAGLSVRLMAWAATSADASVVAFDVREEVVGRLTESDVASCDALLRGSPDKRPD